MPCPRRGVVFAFVACLLALALSGCNLLPASLDPAAVAYYNYMQGLAPGKKYSSFTSPAYRKAMPKETITKLDDVMSRSRKKNEAATPLKAADLRSVTDNRYGLSAAAASASFAALSLGETQWVKDGGKWYLYLGTDAEIEKYGAFPVTLQLPAPEPRAGQPDPDAPQ